MDESAATSGNDTAPPAPDAAPVPPPARTIGERLRAARERSGLSIPAAAEKLHLDTKVVEALEADRFAEVGASVYVRGHLKRYADFVGEPGAEFVTMYNTRETRAAAPDLTQFPHPERRADPRRLVTPLVALGCSAVLLAAVWWVLSGSHAGGAKASLAQSAPASELPLPAPAVTATPAGLSTSTPIGKGEITPVEHGADLTASGATTPPGKETPAREIRLRLELTNDSWVEVYDSNNQRLFYDVATGGSVQSVSGRGPLRVVLENAAGVSVQIDGEPREIPAGAVEGERARFVVNRSGTLSRSR
jgi:cytoskeleton protein RodZ